MDCNMGWRALMVVMVGAEARNLLLTAVRRFDNADASIAVNQYRAMHLISAQTFSAASTSFSLLRIRESQTIAAALIS